ncbi:MAG: transposase, partial [Mycoplasmataceae bacterium]|nr:transposase [Mycoplasmataceae bacterium]
MQIFNHYVAVDWAMSNMAIARMTEKSNKITTIDVPADITELKFYLKNLKGTICMTIEETTSTQWLYTELLSSVKKLLICDPYRNKLLSEGPKTDKIDAEKLVKLLRADLLKEVFHTNDKFVELRKIVSAYEDMIKAGVRFKNQRSALFRAYNLNHKKEDELEGEVNTFVLNGLDSQIENYEYHKERYKSEFKKLVKVHPEIKRLKDIPGIGEVGAVKIISRVVDAHRFATRNHFLSYCGLIKLEKISGGKSYGKKNSRYCRMMKGVFKTAVLAATIGN